MQVEDLMTNIDDDAGFRLLADELSLRPVIEIAKGTHDRRAPRHTSDLGALFLINVSNVQSRYRSAVEPPAHRDAAVARMLGIEPIGPPPADRIELDALDDPAAIGKIAITRPVEKV